MTWHDLLNLITSTALGAFFIRLILLTRKAPRASPGPSPDEPSGPSPEDRNIEPGHDDPAGRHKST